jgi:hypothetical protein
MFATAVGFLARTCIETLLVVPKNQKMALELHLSREKQ